MALQRINDENGKVIGHQRSERGSDLAAFKQKCGGNRTQQLKPERDQTAVKHADRPAAGNVFRRCIFFDDLCVKPDPFAFEIICHNL